MTFPFISIIIPCYNEEKFIGKCLKTILEQDYQGDLEVLVVDGISEDNTRKKIEEFKIKNSKAEAWQNQARREMRAKLSANFKIKILDNPEKFTPFALNIGIKEAKGDIIIRMDAHAGYEKDYISKCVRHLKEYNVDNIGGTMRTLPTGKSLAAKAIAFCLSHFFGAASCFRVGSKEPREVDTVFGGCYKKEVFDKVGLFNENLIRSQDMEFNLRLKKAGGKILLHPEIVSYYYPKSNLKDFLKHNIKDGIWAIYPLKFVKIPFKLRHYIPLLFVLGFFLTLILGLFFFPAKVLFNFVFGSYLILTLFFSFQTALKEKDLRFFFIMPIVFFVRHFGYGFGSILGLVKVLIGEENSVLF